jgi:hypothetical protein
MHIKVKKKDSLLMLLYVVILNGTGCTGANKPAQSTGISVELNKVLSNYPAKEVDTISPLPEIVFILAFKNASKQDYNLKFQNLMTGKDSELRVSIKCSNGEFVTLPLFQNTDKSSFLKKQSEIILSFKAKPKDILIGLKNCGGGYLGEIIERETRNLTVVYETEGLTFQSHCVRQKFESPEYFLLE